MIAFLAGFAAGIFAGIFAALGWAMVKIAGDTDDDAGRPRG